MVERDMMTRERQDMAVRHVMELRWEQHEKTVQRMIKFTINTDEITKMMDLMQKSDAAFLEQLRKENEMAESPMNYYEEVI